jgi:hypothetical protein
VRNNTRQAIIMYTQQILDFGFSIPDDLEIFRQQRA